MYATRSRKGIIFIMFARILKTTVVRFGTSSTINLREDIVDLFIISQMLIYTVLMTPL